MYYQVFNPTSGQILGFYKAETERDAIEASVKDAGYDSIEDMERRLEQPCELQASDPLPPGYFIQESDRRVIVDGDHVGYWLEVVCVDETLPDEYETIGEAVEAALFDAKLQA
jgi:hypothetical protein